ncbi:hypothetical protein Tco_0006065 [Tanacetum coccineum]
MVILMAVGPHGSGGSSKDGDGDTSFQWSQFTTPCSHLMFLINDIMTTERPTTQLPQDCNKYEHVGPKVTSTQDDKRSQDDD